MASGSGSPQNEGQFNSNSAPDFELPQACIQRIIKNTLPDNIAIGKDARAAFSKAAGIFVLYVTHASNDFCKSGKRQIITAADVISAMDELGFNHFIPILDETVKGHRQEKRSAKAQGGTSKKQKKDKITENSAVSQAETEAHSQEISQDLPGIVPSTLITNKETFAVVDHSSQDALN